MVQNYFLGANSRDGFSSLYRFFPGSRNDFCHIIKGGPGTGKSGFMRRIGRAAEERGFDVHYVLCSGDPDSLDGVYLPALHLGWVDGTSPHVEEPRCFGADSDYVNLGSFCRSPFSPEDREQLVRLTERHKRLYAAVYRSLATAEIVETGEASAVCPSAASAGNAYACLPEQRFLHAISCQGELYLWNEIKKLCKQVEPLTPGALHALSQSLERTHLPAVRCPSPLDPAQLEAVLLPWADRAYVANVACRGLEDALALLREAKATHDKIESLIRPYMDFAALTEYTDRVVREVFG